MHLLKLEELDDLSSSVEAAVDATPEIDPWCSGPDWLIPVSTAFAPEADRLILQVDCPGADPTCGFVFLARYITERGTKMFGGLEPLWGFGAPIVGADPVAVTNGLVNHLQAIPDWQILFLPGMPQPDDKKSFTFEVATALAQLGNIRFNEGITRQVADLSKGYDAWLAARTSKFRRNLRQTATRSKDMGVQIESVASDSNLFERIIAIERRSWKGQEDSGITSPEMTAMYTAMIERLRPHGRVQAHVAKHDGNDLGYILGGIRDGRYRGLQLSYVAEAHHLSIGNLLQDHQLQELSRLNLAHTYDLGMDFDYKRRWADRAETSVTLIVDRAKPVNPRR